jgi:hypothetical protein
MKNWRGLSLLLGAVLVIGGIILLLGNIGVFELGDLFWGLVLGAVGIFFILLYFQDRRQWWAWIPGITLLSIALLLAMQQIFPSTGFDLGGVIVPAGIGLSFLIIYLTTRQHWWAIIPGGVMVSIAAMILLQGVFPADWEMAGVGVFFLGLGLTFLALAQVDTPNGKMKWPWIPGGILLAMCFIFIMVGSAAEFFPYIGALALIVVGVFLLWRALRRNDK